MLFYSLSSCRKISIVVKPIGNIWTKICTFWSNAKITKIARWSNWNERKKKSWNYSNLQWETFDEGEKRTSDVDFRLGRRWRRSEEETIDGISDHQWHLPRTESLPEEITTNSISEQSNADRRTADSHASNAAESSRCSNATGCSASDVRCSSSADPHRYASRLADSNDERQRWTEFCSTFHAAANARSHGRNVGRRCSTLRISGPFRLKSSW